MNFSGDWGVHSAQLPGGETLVVTEVGVGFCSIIEDIDFPVLERTHRPRVDV